MADATSSSSAERVHASFALPVGGGQLHVSATLPAGQTNLTELLPIIQNLQNAVVSRVADEAAQAGTPISCGPGCGACCRQMVPISLFEAEALAAWMRSLPEERRHALQERFHRALVALRDAGVIDKLVGEEWVHGGEPAVELAVDYFHAGVPCPFLENESCSVHAMRPLVCREYLVTSPPELCADPSVHQVAGVQLPLKLSRALYAMGRRLSGDPRGWIPLVFLMAWTRSEVSPGDFYRGTGEEVLRQFLEEAAATQSDGGR